MRLRGNTKKMQSTKGNYYDLIILSPTVFGTAPVPSLNTSIQRVLERLYWGIPLPQTPVTDKHVSHDERNRLICARYAAGETLQAIALDLGLSHQRVHQIIRRWC